MDRELTGAIRQAVASGDVRRMALLWNEYAAGIEQEIRGGTCTAARMAEAGELAEWSRLTWLCARSHIQERLDAIGAAARYAPARSQPPMLLRTSL